MGLFGGIGKALKGINWDRVSAGLSAAGASSHGDHGTAAQIWGQYGQRRGERAQAEAEARQRAQLEAAAVQMGVPPQQAASLPTSALAGLVSQQYQPRAPSEFERAAQAGGIAPGSPDWVKLNRQRAETMALPSPQPIVDPQTGSVRWVTPPMPGTSGPAQSGAGLPTVSDDASYNALPPGAQYRDPQGNVRTKGGGGSNVTGGFRPGFQRVPGGFSRF